MYSHETVVIVRNRTKVTALPKHPAEGFVLLMRETWELKLEMWELKFSGMCDACLGFNFCVTVRDLTGIKLQGTSDVHVGVITIPILSTVCANEICQLANFDLQGNRC